MLITLLVNPGSLTSAGVRPYPDFSVAQWHAPPAPPARPSPALAARTTRTDARAARRGKDRGRQV